MLGKELDKNLNKQIKKSVYDQLQQKGTPYLSSIDLQRLIDQKDQAIRKLQYRIQKLQKQNQQLLASAQGGNADNFYKQKLQMQIQDNQTAFQLFLILSHRMTKMIQMLKLSPSLLSEDSSQMKNILKMMGALQQDNKTPEISLDQSEIENMEAMKEQVSKKIEELQIICDTFHKNFMKMQKQSSGMQKKLQQVKKLYQDQVKAVQKQLKQARIGRQHFKNLLQKNQQQKKQILQSIANCLDAKTRSSISTMSREQLVDYIKKLTFKASELQTKKTQILRQNQKIKTTDLQKYKKMLNQVKQVKELSRMGNSVM